MFIAHLFAKEPRSRIGEIKIHGKNLLYNINTILQIAERILH